MADATYAAYQAEKHAAPGAVAPPAVGKLAPTQPDILGPFYRPGSPYRVRLHPAVEIVLEGTVTYDDGTPVVGQIEFWQADAAGKYDEHGPALRGIQDIGPDGRYRLETVMPGHYDISPGGDPEPHEFRCPHIHAKVWVGGRDVLTTQLYFSNDRWNAKDHWFDPRRVVQSLRAGHGFDFVIAKKGAH